MVQVSECAQGRKPKRDARRALVKANAGSGKAPAPMIDLNVAQRGPGGVARRCGWRS
jgi:hypothetical protein